MNLKDEIIAGESYSLEFKLVPNEDRAKYLKTVVAFANGKGGRILFGVANDRTVVGVPGQQIFQQMDAIADSISNCCAPQIPMDVSIEHIDGKSVIASLENNGLGPLEIIEDVVDVRVNVRRRAANGKVPIEGENTQINGDNMPIGARTLPIDVTKKPVGDSENGALSGALNGALNGALEGDGALERSIQTLIAANPGINRKTLAVRTGTPSRSLDRMIATMIGKGRIERRGSKKTGGYYCKEG